jgi:serine/threonine protein kinase
MRGAEICPSETPPEWAETWSRGTLGSLGRFQLRERLGDGGFGQVFLAYDPRLDRDVALKVLKQANPTDRVMERFFREARAAARLDHPNIVAVHDAGFDNGRCWVAFHFVGGRPLGWYRDHHRLDPPTAARILRDLADAVDHAHRQGVLHRDLKPANVLIDDHARPRLIDFGLSRRSDLDSSLTRDGAVVGTPAYMSPEQALGFSRQVDERSDVFSLGVIFYEALSGQRPNPPEAPSAGSAEPVGSQPSSPRRPRPSVRAVNPTVPRDLDRICRRAMADNPEDRYASARELADDLDRWLLRQKSTRGRIPVPLVPALVCLAGTLLLVFGVLIGRWSVSNAHAVREQTPEPKAAPPAASPVAQTAQFIGNLAKRKYHLPDCPEIVKMSEANRVNCGSPEEASSLGLRPCAHCKPLVALGLPHEPPGD